MKSSPKSTAVKGDPKKPNKSTIDRSKYSEALNKPIEGVGTNVVGDRQDTFSPEVLKGMGYNYVSGTMGNKDIVYEKNGNYHLYNEQPKGSPYYKEGYNQYGLINIGNPDIPAKASITTNPLTNKSVVEAPPVVNSTRKPLDFNNPSGVYNPNNETFTNPNTGQIIEPIVEQYKKGTTKEGVKPMSKYYKKKLATGGVVPQYGDGTAVTSQGTAIQVTGASPGYSSSFANANSGTATAIENDKEKKQRSGQGRAAANQAGQALGTYGTGYFASQNADNQSEDMYNKGMATVSGAGAIGGAIGGITALVDVPAGREKKYSERTDENGNLVDAKKATTNAFIGGLFNPAKAASVRASYKGGWTDWTGKGYLKHIETQAKDKMAAERQDNLSDNAIINEARTNDALAARDAGELDYRPDTAGLVDVQAAPDYSVSSTDGMTNNFSRLTKGSASDKRKAIFGREKSIFNGGLKEGKKDGGVIKGAGTGTSDSIDAQVEEGSFIVPKKNSRIAELVRKNILNTAPKKQANLKQRGETPVSLSNGEHMFTPEEKHKIIGEMGEEFLEELAPNAEDNDSIEYKDGTTKDGVKKDDEYIKKELDKIEAQRKADTIRMGAIKAKQISDEKKRAFRANTYKGLEQQSKDRKQSKSDLSKSKSDYDEVKKEFEDYVKQSDKYSSETKQSDLDNAIGRNGVKVSREDINKEKERILKDLKTKEAAYNKAKSDVEYSNKESNYVDYGSTKSTKDKPLNYFTGDEGQPKKDIPSKTGQEIEDATAEDVSTSTSGGSKKSSPKGLKAETVIPEEDYRIPAIPISAIPASKLAIDPETGETALRTSAPSQAEANLIDSQEYKDASNPTYGASDPKKKFDYSNILGNAINYGVPAFQIGMGLRNLKKAGDRPVDSLSPEYLRSINIANNNTLQAQERAKYGYTGDQLASMNMENNNLTNSERGNARLYSGGNGAVGLNLERAAINDSFGRNMQIKVNDNQLKMQKQQQAIESQRYADSLIDNKQSRLRQFYGDNNTAWHEKTSSAANLANTGLVNALDGYRAGERLKNYEEIMKNSKV